MTQTNPKTQLDLAQARVDAHTSALRLQRNEAMDAQANLMATVKVLSAQLEEMRASVDEASSKTQNLTDLLTRQREAITSLKEENDSLKEENASLKETLSQLEAKAAKSKPATRTRAAKMTASSQ